MKTSTAQSHYRLTVNFPSLALYTCVVGAVAWLGRRTLAATRKYITRTVVLAKQNYTLCCFLILHV